MTLTQTALQTEIRLQIIPASHFPQLIRLHREVFPREQVACTIYGCKGIARYLASQVAFPQFQREHVLWGAWEGKRLIGYAHFRGLPASWHLNNIAVHPGYQGRGAGRRLWQRFIDTARQRQFGTITLDVESDNRPVIDWYRRQGLEITGEVYRYEKELEGGVSPSGSPGEAQHSPRLEGWDQAEAWQAAYGFSQFEIEWGGELWAIGRLGRRYFKVGRRLPGEVEAALAQIDPARRLLVFCGEPLHSPGFIPRGKSLRMSGRVSQGGGYEPEGEN